jgi:integrating conjugative element protein (TIGR03746 family)
MVFKAWKKLEQQNSAIKSLWVVIGILVLLNVFISLFLATAPNRIRVYIPPDLSQGATMQAGVPDKSNVYAFAFQIFTSINSWPDSGTKNYESNVFPYKNYLSASFFNQLEEDVKDRTQNGELERTRIMSGVSDMGYKPADVTSLGNGAWLVNLHLQIIETLEGSVIKSVIMDYPLVVNQVSESIQINPWGFVIAGFNESPYRIKTII